MSDQPPSPTPLPRLLRTLVKIGIVSLITLLLLEVAARVVWRGRDCLPLQDNREICLLPVPLLTAQHLQILDTFAALEAGGKNFDRYDPVLGWSIRPNSRTVENGTPYESNDIGVRAERSYALQPPPGVTRISVFGPSFAHADDVTLHDSWPYLLEHSQPNLEVMNWGVGGYGTDQAFLRYVTQGAAYQPHVVLIAYEEDNLRRNVNRYRPFVHAQTGLPLTKPVYVLEGDGLRLLDNPFATLADLRAAATGDPQRFLDLTCEHDFFCVRERYQPHALDRLSAYRLLRTLAFDVSHRGQLPYLTTWAQSYADPHITEVTARLLETFVRTVREDGATPVVLFFAYRPTFEDAAAGKPVVYQALVDRLRSSGTQALDLTPEFVAANAGSDDFTGYFAPGGHYNEAGNHVVSQAVRRTLCRKNLLTDCDAE
jgi:hypothetical protein